MKMLQNPSKEMMTQFLYYAFIRYRNREHLIENVQEYFTSYSDLLCSTEEDFYFLQESPMKALYQYIVLTRELCIRSIDMPIKTILNEDTFLNFIYMLYTRLYYLKTESIIALFFSKKKAFLSIENIGIGSDRKAFFDTKLLLQKLYMLKSYHCIIAHNHPSGIENPSLEDIRITEELSEQLSNSSFSLIDHVIITRNAIYSIKQEKILANTFR